MKKIVFTFITTLILTNFSFGQTSWKFNENNYEFELFFDTFTEGNERNEGHLTKIVIKKSNEIYQILDSLNLTILCNDKKERIFNFDDINFDNYKDFYIRVKNNKPYSENINFYFNYWIFNEKNNKYEASTLLNDIPNPYFEKKTKQIYSHIDLGGCSQGSSEQDNIYSYSNDKVILVEQTERQQTFENDKVTNWIIKRKLIDGQLKEIYSKENK